MPIAFDPVALQSSYRQLEEGEPRMRAMRAAITEAEQAQDLRAQMIFHHDLIRESVFSGDRYQALIDFPRYYALYTETDALRAEFRDTVLWVFKWILQAATEFPQIPKAQVLQWFSKFRRELLCAGYSLRPFYNLRALFYSYMDGAKLRLDYEDFLNAPIDRMADGEADLYDNIVQWELRFGNRDKALRAMEHIQQKNLHSDEVPAKPYGFLLEDALQRSDFEAADHYATLLRPLCIGRRFRMQQLGSLLCYTALRDPAAGLELLHQHQPMRDAARNPFLCFWFDRGAMLLCQRAAAQSSSSAELNATAEHFRGQALDIAKQFDARNGSDYFTQALCVMDAIPTTLTQKGE